MIVEFLEQLAYVGMVEEFFFRGYLMGRFCKWLGDIKGLLLNAVNFSLTHIIFLFSRYGLTYVRGELIIGFQTFVGGLLLIYIYLRAGDIIPGSTYLPQYVPVKVVMRWDASRLASMCQINPPAHLGAVG